MHFKPNQEQIRISLPGSVTILFLLLCALISHSSLAQKETIQLPKLAKELIKMRDEDQKNRIKWSGMIRKGKNDTEKFKAFTDELIALDRANTVRMREIVNAHGWPTYDLVGKRASNSAWLLVQHADRNPMFQVKCLPLLKAAVDNGQANPSNYAFLYDRVQVALGQKQLFATQSSTNNGLTEGAFYPIADESEVQNRREAHNISKSVEDYASGYGFSYQILSVADARDKAAQQTADYEQNVAKAKAAMASEDFEQATQYYLEVTRAFGDVQAEDFVAAAKAASLARHENSKSASGWLLKALLRGWDGMESIKTDADFDYLRTSSPERWQDFLRTAAEIALDR